MKLSFQRITTSDGLELQGLLYEPDSKTDKALVHVHAWVGNFYENTFIDFIAKEATQRGFAFLTFNNRGLGFVTDFIKRNESGFSYVRIGGSVERFEDCEIDIRASLDLLASKGYQKIVLEGHSTGCQKVTYYRYSTQDKRIRGLIELAPADDVAAVQKILGKRYEEGLAIARKMVKENCGDKVVPEWMQFYPLLCAKTFLTVADPTSSSGKIFYYAGNLEEIKSVDCPILVAFGSNDDYQENPGEKLTILEKSINKCSTKMFQEANHWFIGYEDQLARSIGDWITTI